jgi:hypothetical protein
MDWRRTYKIRISCQTPVTIKRIECLTDSHWKAATVKFDLAKQSWDGRVEAGNGQILSTQAVGPSCCIVKLRYADNTDRLSPDRGYLIVRRNGQGVDFSVETHSSDKKLHSCWLIPERGSWIELNVTKKDVLAVRIDQSGKFPATALLRAMSEEFSTDTDVIRRFYTTKKVALGAKNFKKQVEGKRIATWVLDTESGEVLLKPIDGRSLESGRQDTAQHECLHESTSPGQEPKQATFQT